MIVYPDIMETIVKMTLAARPHVKMVPLVTWITQVFYSISDRISIFFFQARSRLLNVPVKQVSPVLTVLFHHVTTNLVKTMENVLKMHHKMRAIFVTVSLASLKRLKIFLNQLSPTLSG